MSAILARFHNAEDNVTGEVVQGAKGKFHVALRDEDSGECLPQVRIMNTFAEACALAKKWANA